MRSKARFLGHAIHPMLVSFPIALYSATVVAYMLYAFDFGLFWFRFAYYTNLGGWLMAIVAAIPGYIDFKNVIPYGKPAKDTARIHLTLNILAFVLFGMNLIAQRPQLDNSAPGAAGAIFLTGLGLLFTASAGYFGWKLVQEHHVGVDLTPEQERADDSRRPRAG